MPEVLRFIISPKTKKVPPSYHVDTVIEVKDKKASLFMIKSYNKPGVLARVSSIIAEAGKNIEKIGVPEKPSEDTTYFYILVSNCDKECSDSIKEKITSLDDVLEVEYYLPNYGYVIPEYREIKFVDVPALLFTEEMIAKYAYYIMTRGGRSVPIAETGYLSHTAMLGRAIGETLFDYISRYVSEEGSIEEQYRALIELFKSFLVATGFGRVDVQEVSMGRKYIVIFRKGAIECRGLKKYHFNMKTGYITEALIEAFFRRMTGRRVVVSEKKCINKMHSFCEFEVEIAETLFGP